MIFRRLLAEVLMLMYVVISVGGFMVFAVSNTVFKPSFYQGDVSKSAYEFLINVTIQKLNNEPVINQNFKESDLRREILTVFPYKVFTKIVDQFSNDMGNIKEDPTKPIVIRLAVFKEALLTMAHDLSFQLYNSIPTCAKDVLPKEDDNGLPDCIPPEANYNIIFASYSDQVERAINDTFRDQIQIDMNTSIGDSWVLSDVINGFDTVKIVIYISMLVLIVLIALLIYHPFTSIVSHEGAAFLISGMVGIILEYLIIFVSPSIADKISDNSMRAEAYSLIDKAIKLFAGEIQKVALISIALGACLIIVRLFMRHKQA